MIAFGPIHSRRLGMSLGINNIVSHKVCTYSCIYCQIGLTRLRSSKREQYYEPDQVYRDVKNHLNKIEKNCSPEYLTFVANGEPTMDLNLGKEIDLLKNLKIPVAVITNSSLIYDLQVQEDLMKADWVSVKIDTIDEPVWDKVNQPHQKLVLKEILQGLVDFSKSYKGILTTETMLLKDLNDSEVRVSKTASFISALNPVTAYLSVPIRPPAVKGVKPPSAPVLIKSFQIFENQGIKTQFLNAFEGTETGTTGNVIDDILNITAVHPMREDTMKELLRKNNSTEASVKTLISQGLLEKREFDGNFFYVRRYHIME
jgi:wyosine [tRNA(Phe)-imidazoG37] synthetase (radical SAM superfamily)